MGVVSTLPNTKIPAPKLLYRISPHSLQEPGSDLLDQRPKTQKYLTARPDHVVSSMDRGIFVSSISPISRTRLSERWNDGVDDSDRSFYLFTPLDRRILGCCILCVGVLLYRVVAMGRPQSRYPSCKYSQPNNSTSSPSAWAIAPPSNCISSMWSPLHISSRSIFGVSTPLRPQPKQFSIVSSSSVTVLASGGVLCYARTRASRYVLASGPTIADATMI